MGSPKRSYAMSFPSICHSFFIHLKGMGITAFYGASMEDEDAVKLLRAAYDMGYRRGRTKSDPKRDPKFGVWKMSCGR